MAPADTLESSRGWKRAWILATADGVPRRSLKVAIVVGTALNLINQGDALFGAAPVNGFKLMLTFAMPYAVSTYGAVTVRWGPASDGKFLSEIAD